MSKYQIGRYDSNTRFIPLTWGELKTLTYTDKKNPGIMIPIGKTIRTPIELSYEEIIEVKGMIDPKLIIKEIRNAHR